MLKMATKKRRYKRRNKKTANIDVVIIATIVVNIIVAILLYAKSGYVGNLLSDVLRWHDGATKICFTFRRLYSRNTSS